MLLSVISACFSKSEWIILTVICSRDVQAYLINHRHGSFLWSLYPTFTTKSQWQLELPLWSWEACFVLLPIRPLSVFFPSLSLPSAPVVGVCGWCWLFWLKVSPSPYLEAPLHTLELFHISEFIVHICRCIFCYLVILRMIMLMRYSPEFSFWSQIVSI